MGSNLKYRYSTLIGHAAVGKKITETATTLLMFRRLLDKKNRLESNMPIPRVCCKGFPAVAQTFRASCESVYIKSMKRVDVVSGHAL